MRTRLGKGAASAQSPQIQNERLEGVVALLPTMPGFDDTAPQGNALLHRLFGEDGKRVYAVLDAARVPNLVETLEGSTLRHRCLFTGDALENFAAVAPWVVELDKDAMLTLALLSADADAASPWALWLTEPGIFLRCEAGLDQVWSHLRKYTRLKTEDGRWVFFRFWDPVLLAVFSRYPMPLARFWARFLDGAELVIPDPLLAAAGIVLPADAQSDAVHSGGTIDLSDVPEGILRVQRRVVLARGYVRMMRDDPDTDTSGLSKLPLPDQLTHIEADIALAQREGLDKPDHVFRFVMLLHKARQAGVQGGAFASRARSDWTTFPAARKIAELEFDFKDLLDAADT